MSGGAGAGAGAESFMVIYQVKSVDDPPTTTLQIKILKEGDPYGTETVFKDGTTLRQRTEKADPGIGTRIAYGSFGDVHKLTLVENPVISLYPSEVQFQILPENNYIIKSLKIINEEAAYRELLGLFSVYHLPFCSKLIGAIIKKGGAYFLMDYIEGETYDVWNFKITSQLTELAGLGGANSSSPYYGRYDKLSTRKFTVDTAFLSHVDEIHKAGLLHRDIKPNNIMITPADEPIIIDFGLSSLINAEDMGPHGHRAYTHPRYNGTKNQDTELDIEALIATISAKPFSTFLRHGGVRQRRKSRNRKRNRSTRGRSR